MYRLSLLYITQGHAHCHTCTALMMHSVQIGSCRTHPRCTSPVIRLARQVCFQRDLQKVQDTDMQLRSHAKPASGLNGYRGAIPGHTHTGTHMHTGHMCVRALQPCMCNYMYTCFNSVACLSRGTLYCSYAPHAAAGSGSRCIPTRQHNFTL